MLKEGDLRRRTFLRLATIGVAATQCGVFGTARAQSDESKPDEESEITYDNEAIVRQAYHTAEGSVMDVPEFVALFADDGVINLGHAGVEPLGLASYQGDNLGGLVVSVATYFPDIHRELHRVNVLGDMVAVELSIQGTFVGPPQTLPAPSSRRERRSTGRAPTSGTYATGRSSGSTATSCSTPCASKWA